MSMPPPASSRSPSSSRARPPHSNNTGSSTSRHPQVPVGSPNAFANAQGQKRKATADVNVTPRQCPSAASKHINIYEDIEGASTATKPSIRARVEVPPKVVPPPAQARNLKRTTDSDGAMQKVASAVSPPMSPVHQEIMGLDADLKRKQAFILSNPKFLPKRVDTLESVIASIQDTYETKIADLEARVRAHVEAGDGEATKWNTQITELQRTLRSEQEARKVAESQLSRVLAKVDELEQRLISMGEKVEGLARINDEIMGCMGMEMNVQ